MQKAIEQNKQTPVWLQGVQEARLWLQEIRHWVEMGLAIGLLAGQPGSTELPTQPPPTHVAAQWRAPTPVEDDMGIHTFEHNGREITIETDQRGKRWTWQFTVHGLPPSKNWDSALPTEDLAVNEALREAKRLIEAS